MSEDKKVVDLIGTQSLKAAETVQVDMFILISYPLEVGITCYLNTSTKRKFNLLPGHPKQNNFIQISLVLGLFSSKECFAFALFVCLFFCLFSFFVFTCCCCCFFFVAIM